MKANKNGHLGCLIKKSGTEVRLGSYEAKARRHQSLLRKGDKYGCIHQQLGRAD